jgi:hypothetical protein
MRKSDVFQFQSQALSAMIIIQSAEKKPARWESRTVIFRKGKLIGVGGEIKPKDPPAYRVLSEKAYQEFSYGKFETLNDIDKFESYLKNRDSSSESINKIEILNSPKNDVNVAFEILDNVFDEIEKAGDFVKKAISELYKNLEVDKILSQIKKTIDDNQFLSGVASVLNNAVKLGGQVGKATGKLINETIIERDVVRSGEGTGKTTSKIISEIGSVLEGIAFGGLIVAGIGVMGFADIAILGRFLPLLNNLPLVRAFWALPKMTRLAVGLSRFPLKILLNNLKDFFFQKMKDDAIFEKIDSMRTPRLRKELDEVNEMRSPEKRADEVVRFSKTSLQENKIDTDKLRERLIKSSKNKPTSDLNKRYTLENRVLESESIREQLLTEKDPEKLKELQKSYQWHIGLIETDIKYGDSLDKIGNYSEDIIDGSARYDSMQELYKQLSQGKERIPMGKVYTSNYKFNGIIIDKGFADGKQLTADNLNSVYNVNTTSGEQRQVTVDELNELLSKRRANIPLTSNESRIINQSASKFKDLMKLSATHPDIKLIMDTPRGYQTRNDSYNPDTLRIEAVDAIINPGIYGYPPETVFHEGAHAIEIKNNMGDISLDYVKSRSIFDKPVQINFLLGKKYYLDNELAYPSDFADPYTAKAYSPKKDGRQSTELVSTAVQNLIGVTSLEDALKKDREHILYGLWALDYKP